MDHQHNGAVAQSSNQELISRDEGALRQAEIATRKLATSHYENFLVASVLLPRRIRQSFYNVYAFCRTADDFADESPSPEVALQELERFQDQLACVLGKMAMRKEAVPRRRATRAPNNNQTTSATHGTRKEAAPVAEPSPQAKQHWHLAFGWCITNPQGGSAARPPTHNHLP